MECTRASIVVVALIAGPAVIAERAPVPVSPGEEDRAVRVEARCPTFSWGVADGAAAYEVVVHRLGDAGDDTGPVLHRELPGAASSWTPPLDLCLERGARYAWSVRVQGDGAAEWPRWRYFEVAEGPTREELEEALRLVREHLGAELAAVGGPQAGDPFKEGGLAAARDRTAPRITTKAVTPRLTVDGGVSASAFVGDGSNLSNVAATDLQCATCVSESELGFDPASQQELDTHAGSAAAHHEPTAYTAGPGLTLVGTEFETVFRDQRCQDGESIIGFDAAGAMICSGTCLDGGVRRPVVAPTEGDLLISEILADPDFPLLDGDAEWFEVEVVSGVDLNGLELGVAPEDVREKIMAEECLPVSAGQLLVFGRSSDGTSNGGLSPDRLFGFNLANSGGGVFLGYRDQTVDTRSWGSSSPGVSESRDAFGTWCPTPVDGNYEYTAGHHGTPAVVNPSCP